MLRRLHLPGGCDDLERDGEEAVVTVGGGDGDRVWSRTYRVLPGEDAIPFHLASTAAHMLWLWSQAKLVCLEDHGAGSPPTDDDWQRPSPWPWRG